MVILHNRCHGRPWHRHAPTPSVWAHFEAAFQSSSVSISSVSCIVCVNNHFKADRDKSVTGQEVTEEFNRCKCQTQKHVHQAAQIQFNRLPNTESPPLPRPQTWERFDSYRPESRGVIRAIRCASPVQFSVLHYCTEICSNCQGQILKIQDLCLTIAGLSEILIRVLSDVYETQLRFVSADGDVIF